MLHAVVIAGGSGTRFWPASTRTTPKQLLNLVGDRTMIQATIDRLDGLVQNENTWVVTNKNLVESIATQLPTLLASNIVGEPCKRDTAPCVGLAATMLLAQDPDAVMLTLPADHVINQTEDFQLAIRHGLELIKATPERIVTFGIKPSYPAESFGYIERGEILAPSNSKPAFKVARFREKPNAAVAKEYLDSGQFYWNSGIFLWRADVILSAIRKFEPDMAKQLDLIGQSIGSADFTETLDKHFTAIKGKSIDYAVMEHYTPVAVIEATFDWDDVGSWQALSRMITPDSDNNTVQGTHIGIDTSGCIIRCEPDHTIVTIGVDDLIVVQTKNATLVAPKAAEERVREAVKRLEEQGRDDLM